MCSGFMTNEHTKQLKIAGIWKNNGLFAQQQFEEEIKKSLQHEGEVEINLLLEKGRIVEQHTYVTLMLQKNTLLNTSGTDVLYHLYDVYTVQ